MNLKTIHLNVKYHLLQFTVYILYLFAKVTVIGLVVIPLWKIAYGLTVATSLFGIWTWLLVAFCRVIIPIALLLDLIYIGIIVYSITHQKKEGKHGRRSKTRRR